MLNDFIEGMAMGLLGLIVVGGLLELVIRAINDPVSLVVLVVITLAGVIGGIINVVRSR